MHSILCSVFALLATVNAASSGASSKASTTLSKPSAPSAASKVSSISKASKVSSSGSGLPATSCPPVTLSPVTAYPSVFGYCYGVYTPSGGIPYPAEEYTVIQYSTSINVTTTVTLCVPGASSMPKLSSGSSRLPASSPSKATGSASKISSIPTSSKPASSTAKASASSSSSKISSAPSSSKPTSSSVKSSASSSSGTFGSALSSGKPASSSAKALVSSSSSKISSVSPSSTPASSSAKASGSSSSSKISSVSSSSTPASSPVKASGSGSSSKISSSAASTQSASSSTKASASFSSSKISSSLSSTRASSITQTSSSSSVSTPKSSPSSSKASKTTPTPPPYYGRPAKDRVKRQEAGDDSAAYTSLSMLPASCQTSFCSSLAAYPESTYTTTYTYTTTVITSVAPARETCGPTDFCDASTKGAGPVCRPLPGLYKCNDPTLPGQNGGIIQPCTLGGCQGGCFLDVSQNSSSCVVNHRDDCFVVGRLYPGCSSDSDCGRGQRCLYDFCPQGATCTDAEPDCANPASKRSLFRQKRRVA